MDEGETEGQVHGAADASVFPVSCQKLNIRSVSLLSCISSVQMWGTKGSKMESPDLFFPPHPPFPSALRVHLERGVFLPGVLLPLLPDPAGWARLRHRPLLQDERSFRSVPGKPGPQGLHKAGAQLWVHARTEYMTRTQTQNTEKKSCAPEPPQKLSAAFRSLLFHVFLCSSQKEAPAVAPLTV